MQTHTPDETFRALRQRVTGDEAQRLLSKNRFSLAEIYRGVPPTHSRHGEFCAILDSVGWEVVDYIKYQVKEGSRLLNLYG